MKKLLLLLALVFLPGKVGYAQAVEKSGIIKTKDGVLVIWNEPNNYFTVEIKGRQILPAGQGPNLYFNVDGRFLQINTAPLTDFWKHPIDRLHTNEEILREHHQWELDYLGKLFGRQLFPSTDWLKLMSGETALLWTFNVPNATDPNQARKQVYITTVNGDRIYLVNSAVTSIDADEQAIRKYLLDTINTMKRSDKPLSLEKASESVRKAN